MTPYRLSCEYREDPLGIDSDAPRLSWALNSSERGQRQSAYQIVVASSAELLNRQVGDLWDTRRVELSDTVGIPYDGVPLASRCRYCWQVRIWDGDGRVSAWSRPARWETAFLAESDWQAEWINDGRANPTKAEEFYKHDPAPLFRKSFSISGTPVEARLYITGLGYYEASMNGLRIGDHMLDPGWTAYGKRVLYSTYDATDLVRGGENTLGVTLGNGWYNPLPLLMWGRRNLRDHLDVGRPRFIAELHVTLDDGDEIVVTSDRTWGVTDGPLLFNSIYLGEVYDARVELPGWDSPGFDDTDWREPGAATEEVGHLCAQRQPPVRVTRQIAAQSITSTPDNRYIVDMGVNFSGWISIDLDVTPGTEITMRYGELLNSDGSLNPMTSVAGQIKRSELNSKGVEVSIGGEGAPEIAWQADTYIAHGNGEETYTPRFTWHAFRYVEISGLHSEPSLDSVRGLSLRSDVERQGKFTCSDDRLNQIQLMCERTFLSNMMSVQSDCPHRERFGYGGDIAATASAFASNYDMAAFYAKTVEDFADSTGPDGLIPDTAPSVGMSYCGMAWSMVHPFLQGLLYRYYGDRRIIEEQYETAKVWFDAFKLSHPDHIIDSGLSDHESLSENPPAPLVTQFYCHSARLLARLARVLDRDADAKRYSALAQEIRSVYVSKFVDVDTGTCEPGTQSSNVLALKLDMLPDEVRPKTVGLVIDDLTAGTGHLTTGIFGTAFLFEVLSEAGRADIASALALREDSPGFLHMMENGATTLWESWEFSDDHFSHNHPMFGSVSQWIFNWLAGIQPHPDAIGFDRIVIRPQVIQGIDWVDGSYDSVRGLIESGWRREGEKVTLTVGIPANTTATIHMPADSIDSVTEGTHAPLPAAGAPGILGASWESGCAVFEVSSGSYSFISDRTKRLTGHSYE